MRADPVAAQDRHGSVALWFAVFGAPLAWFVSQSTGFFLTSWACDEHAWVLTLVFVLAFFVCSLSGLTAFRLWRRTGGSEPAEDAAFRTRTRFLAFIGVALSTVMGLIALVQILATLALSPCQPAPRGEREPDAFMLPAAAERFV